MSRSALILRHSSRAAHITHSDRYSLIRSFFSAPPALSTRPPLLSPPTLALRRNFYSSCRTRDNRPSAHTTSQNLGPQPHRQKPIPNPHITNDSLLPDNSSRNLHENNYPPFFRRLALSLPHVSRPSRDDFLNAANGMVQRMRVRVRWFFIRNFRKFNADDISAFVTWFLVGQGLWILIGTSVGFATRCFPLCLYFILPGQPSSPPCLQWRIAFASKVFVVAPPMALQD
jgi:mitochondrial distribution and morphology protein 31